MKKLLILCTLFISIQTYASEPDESVCKIYVRTYECLSSNQLCLPPIFYTKVPSYTIKDTTLEECLAFAHYKKDFVLERLGYFQHFHKVKVVYENGKNKTKINIK